MTDEEKAKFLLDHFAAEEPLLSEMLKIMQKGMREMVDVLTEDGATVTINGVEVAARKDLQ
jgi:hypothetical protein